MATATKTYVSKSVTVGLEDITLKDINDAAKTVGAPTDSRLGIGGPAARSADATEYTTYSATFTWSEEV